jgi:hypothetical protein
MHVQGMCSGTGISALITAQTLCISHTYAHVHMCFLNCTHTYAIIQHMLSFYTTNDNKPSCYYAHTTHTLHCCRSYWEGIKNFYKAKEGYLQGQIGNPDGPDKPNKKFYDPRVWVRKAEETMVARVQKACEDLGNVDTLKLEV